MEVVDEHIQPQQQEEAPVGRNESQGPLAEAEAHPQRAADADKDLSPAAGEAGQAEQAEEVEAEDEEEEEEQDEDNVDDDNETEAQPGGRRRSQVRSALGQLETAGDLATALAAG